MSCAVDVVQGTKQLLSQAFDFKQETIQHTLPTRRRIAAAKAVSRKGLTLPCVCLVSVLHPCCRMGVPCRYDDEYPEAAVLKAWKTIVLRWGAEQRYRCSCG